MLTPANMTTRYTFTSIRPDGVNVGVNATESKDGLMVTYADYAALAAENERLRKAGDAMVDHIRKGEEVLFECLDGDDVVAAWNAAKEGQTK